MKVFQPHPSLTGKKIRPGTLLIAKPVIPAEEYKRTVVLILRHDNKATTGIILNKPSLLPVHAMFEMLPVKSPIFIGGPCEPHLVTFIHDIPGFEDAIPVGNGMFWGGDHDYLESKVVIKTGMQKRVRFFAGVTCWKPLQLEREMQQNYWWRAEVSATEIFNEDIFDLRAYALLRDDNLFGVLEEVPDPVMN